MWNIFALFENFIALVGFITKKNSFPPTLSPEKEKELLARKVEGDLEARNLLVEHNLRLVAHIAKKYWNTGIDVDDLISIGTIGLIKAVNICDESKGSLCTLAARCIENELRMYLRSDKKTRREVSLLETVGSDHEGNSLTYMDILFEPYVNIEERMDTREMAETLKSILDKVLTDIELEVIQLRYGLLDGTFYVQREIAAKLGISRSYVSRIESKAVEKLRRSLAKKHVL